MNRELVPRVQLTQVAGDTFEGPIKTEAGQDRVVSDDEAIGALIGWNLTQDQERDAWGDAYVESGRIFTYENGRQLRPAHVSRVFDTLVTKSGLRDIRFHDLPAPSRLSADRCRRPARGYQQASVAFNNRRHV